MTVLGFLFAILFVPSAIYSILIAILALWRDDSQWFAVLMVGIGVAWFAIELSRGDTFSPFMIVPLLIAYSVATAAGILFGRSLSKGYREFARNEDDGE